MADLKQFEDELKSKSLKGYWENVQGDVYREPAASYEPCLWKWRDVGPAMEKAGEMVGLETSFRRVIQFWNPALKNGTSHTLVLNLQMLKPGEEALCHRHMAGAIRFITKGRGVHLVVEGESFEIAEGDFVTTPSWTWHDHRNDSDQTMMWLDGLDSPLVRLLQVDFHEPYKNKKQILSRPEGSSRNELGALRPAWVRQHSIQPPAYCYKWEDTERTLKSVGERPGDPFDAILLEYVNPLTGGPTLPTMSCQIQMLRPAEKTQAHRQTSCKIYHVYRGKGATIIDGERYEWESGDSFVIPQWRFHRHENPGNDNAILFLMTDRPAMEALGFYRREAQEP
jgi:gentisate 1,2-dioxygenase